MSDIDLSEVTKAVEDINKTWDEQKKALDEAQAEVKKFGAEMPETKAKVEKMEADMVKLQEVADQAVLESKRRERFEMDSDGNKVDLDAKALSWARRVTGDRHVEFDAKGMAEYKAAYDKLLRKGEERLTREEVKALSVGSDPDGGYVVHPDMSGRVVKKIFETTPMRAYASVQTTSSDALDGLFDLNEAGAEWVGETQTRAETSTPDIGKWRIPAHELSARPKATQRLLDDADIDMEAWLADKVADKFARSENTAFVNGTGVAQPRGFLTYADGTTIPGQIEQFDTGANGAFAAAPSGGDVLIDAIQGLKAGYRRNAVWAMNRATTGLVRKLKDSDGTYLWRAGIAAGQPDTLLGYPVAPFEDMPDGTTTGALGIAIADWREAYQIVDRIGIRVIRDIYSVKPYIEFYTTKRVGGDMVNFEAIKLVKFAS